LLLYMQVTETKSVELVSEFAAGALFAFGLVYTGMVRPTKVGLVQLHGSALE
jgi:hypothetical protein